MSESGTKTEAAAQAANSSAEWSSPGTVSIADAGVGGAAVSGSFAAPAGAPVQAILEALRGGERFLVCSHSRPDGDAVGSMLAMGMLLRQLGKRADLITADRIPPVYRDLPGADEMRTVMRVRGNYDAAILLECDGLDRTRLLEQGDAALSFYAVTPCLP